MGDILTPFPTWTTDDQFDAQNNVNNYKVFAAEDDRQV